eukprot:698257_1
MSDDGWDRDIYTQDYIVAGYFYLSAIIMVAITAKFMITLRKHGNKPHTNSNDDMSVQDTIRETQMYLRMQNIKVITRASIIAIVLYCLTAIMMPIVLTKWILIDTVHGDSSNRTLINIALWPYGFNLVGLLLFILIRRLKHLSLTPCIAKASYAIFLVPVTASILVMTLAYNTTRTVIGAVYVLFVLMVYTIIVVMYFNQISKLMRRKIEPNENEMNHSQSPPATATTMVDLQTINDTARCAFLVTVCAISNFLCPIFGFIGVSYSKHESHVNTVSMVGIPIDMICNTLCIYLMFQFAEKDYLFLCAKCHRCVLKCCTDDKVSTLQKETHI